MDQWIEMQIRYRLGNWYDKITKQELKMDDLNNTTLDTESDRYFQLSKIFILSQNKDKIIPINIFDQLNESCHDNDLIFGFNRDCLDKNIILLPLKDHYDYIINNEDENDFYLKKNEIIWRGTTTGNITDIYSKRSNRLKIIENNLNNPYIDIGFSMIVQLNNEDIINNINNNYLKEDISMKDQFKYKFILCIEGNDVSTNFPVVLASNSVPIHPYPFDYESIYFGDDLKPWIHFIPCMKDGSDLEYIYNWCMNQLDLCYEIANNGKKYMMNFKNNELYDHLNKLIDKYYSESFDNVDKINKINE